MNNALLYLATVLIWGSTWIAINYQLGQVAVEASVTYRFALAASVLFIYCYIKKLPLNLAPRRHLQVAMFGMSLFGFNYLMLYQGQQYINSALACIAFSVIMIFNIVNARLWFNTAIPKQVYLGGLLGLSGIIILFWPEVNTLSLTDSTLLGLALCLVGTLSASTGNMLSIKNQKDNIPIVQANAWGMLYGTLFMAIVTVAQGKTFSFEFTVPYVTSLLFLSIFGSVIAFGCYLSLMTKIGAHKTSYANILFPAVAVTISTFVEGFSWNTYTLIGLSTILIGNLVVLSKPKKFTNTKAKSDELPNSEPLPILKGNKAT